MTINIWIVTYVDDEVADDFGSRVFHTKAEAEAWATEYESDNDPDSDGTEGTHRFTTIAKHTVELPAPAVTTSSGLVYKPWTMGAVVGYEMTHPSGAVNYIYFNPTIQPDDDTDNVFVYCGSAGEPNEDEAISHFEVDTYQKGE